MSQGKVSFRYKDDKRNSRRAMTLDANEFFRRFLLHILPKGFMRIRHYGLLANCCRKKKLALCRRLLGQGQTPDPPEAQLAGCDPLQPELCPVCQQGRLAVVETCRPWPDEPNPG